MPRATVQFIFMSPNMFSEPSKRAYWSVFSDALIESITAEVGYEAILADFSYAVKGFENIGFKIKFYGFNDKLKEFISVFFKTLAKSIKNGIQETFIRTAIEKSIKHFKNINIEVDQKTSNNRLLFLLEH